jgi:hypothetical protein
MLSLTFASDFLELPPASPRTRQAHKKEANPAQKGGLKFGGTMPKSSPGRNAGSGTKRRFLKGIRGKPRRIAALGKAGGPGSRKTQKPA